MVCPSGAAKRQMVIAPSLSLSLCHHCAPDWFNGSYVPRRAMLGVFGILFHALLGKAGLGGPAATTTTWYAISMQHSVPAAGIGAALLHCMPHECSHCDQVLPAGSMQENSITASTTELCWPSSFSCSHGSSFGATRTCRSLAAPTRTPSLQITAYPVAMSPVTQVGG